MMRTLIKFVIVATFLWLLIEMQNSKPYYLKSNYYHLVNEQISRHGNYSKKIFIKAVKEFTNGWALKRFKTTRNIFERLQTKTQSILLGDSVIINSDGNHPPGHMGKPVLLNKKLNKKLQDIVDDGYGYHAFNMFVSDLISVHRSLPDYRINWCRQPNQFEKNLPAVSVIICFHNEAWSTLIRTIHSVISRSPDKLLKEIILVDDYSTIPDLIKPLNDYVKTLPKVKILRPERREGLIRSRLIGVAQASAPVLVFLDSHCECTEGWLEPLLDRIVRDGKTIVSPIIDIIDLDTFEYIAQEPEELQIGGFNWDLQFVWQTISQAELAQRPQIAAPIYTPTISGGLFAIKKEYFESLGKYDDGFEIWGRENLELSFKTWMCGGKMEIVPCSHVGHVFRKRIPYSGTYVGFLKRNSIRLAKVWLDDYAKYVYERIGGDDVDYGDVTSRIELRGRLNCKSFEWYLKNIYPEQAAPNKRIAFGEIHSVAFKNICLDSTSSNKALYQPVGLYPCHKQGGKQFWTYSKNGELQQNDMCLDSFLNTVIGFLCHGAKGSQDWKYNPKTQQIKQPRTNKCLEAHYGNETKVSLEICSFSEAQKWILENYKD